MSNLTFRVSSGAAARRRSQEVLLVDAVPQTVWDVADDCPPDLAGRHLAQLGRGRLAVEGGVGRTQQVGGIFQGTL